MTAGQIRFFARQELRSVPVPVFRDRALNRAIIREGRRLMQERTYRRRPGPSVRDWE